MIVLLIVSDVDINAADKEKRTALHWAVYNQKLAFVKVLLSAGAEVDCAGILLSFNYI